VFYNRAAYREATDRGRVATKEVLMDNIYRWLNPEGLEAVNIDIPADAACSAVNINEEGAGVIKLERPEDGSPIEFPVVQVWDDPARSPVLKRSKRGWRDEDPTALLRQWEEVRLQMFFENLLKNYHTMQVVYLQPPTAEAVAFHHGDTLFEGWRIEMVAAFFGGFKPEGFEEYTSETKPKIIITDVGPDLRVV
jgi:hypothetical protein